MFSKLKDWLGADKQSPLSEQQAQEIAHELNRPILESIQNPKLGFVSSRQFGSTDVGTRIRNISWFCESGNPAALKLSMPIRQVNSWQEAESLCRNIDWENTELEAKNQLTGWLSQHARPEFRKWNNLVEGFKSSLITPIVDPAVRNFSRVHGINEEIVHSVTWDTLSALMENEYLYTGHHAFFFLELLEVYEAGHFPCGWAGNWPQGELYVF